MKKEFFENTNGVTYEILERSVSKRRYLLLHSTEEDTPTPYIIAWGCPENDKGPWGARILLHINNRCCIRMEK